MVKYFLSTLFLMCVLCGRVFADGVYEFFWSMPDLNYEVLVIVSDDSDIAVGKVRMTYKDGSLFSFINEKFRAEVVADGVIFYGYGTPWGYNPDNFLLHKSGRAFNIDDAGNTSPLWVRPVNKNDLPRIIRKYQIR